MSEETKQRAEFLIKFFNMQTGMSFRFSKEANMAAAERLIVKYDNDIVTIKIS